MKKFLFSIICTLMPFVASAQEPYVILIDNGTALEFRYDNDKSAYRDAMDIPQSGSEVPWSNYYESVHSVVFNESFANCTSIIRTDSWFSHFTRLETIIGLEFLNTSNVLYMESMFYGCSSLTSLNVSGFNTGNVTTMNNMFLGCSSLTSLDLSNFKTDNVTDMGGMFMECNNLSNLNLSGFSTNQVTNMVAMFYNCPNLTTIYVGSTWSTASVTVSDNQMFSNCHSLVGGQGTTYDSSHTGASYAHIDGGTSNPGYLTGASSSQEESWWVELRSTLDWGADVLSRARNFSGIDPWMVEELEMFLERGNEMYNEHTAGEEEVRHMIEELNWIIREIEEAMRNQQPDDPHSHGDASFDGLTAWVNGSSTLDDAFTNVGGRSEAAKTIAAIVWNADEPLTADMLDGISNPNLLVFVTEASKAPSGVQNLVINGTAAEIILTDASGNNNFYCPQSFTAQSISYTRNFSQTTQIDVCQGWETISLPFTVQSIRHQNHGALIPFGGGNNGYPFWLRQLSSSGLSRATAIEANRPYLICMPNNTVYPSVYNQAGNITFSATNVTVPATSEQSASGAGVTLRPAFQEVAQSSSVYALNVGEARGSSPEGSVFERNYRAIRPFQAYTTHSSGTRFITLQSLGLGGDDTTGIEAIDTEEADDGNATWHTLDGRRLEGKPVKKGVYIKDGRKYIIK